MEDRTGESCPSCKTGKLYPTGNREVAEPDKTPYNGEAHREFTEYECNVCKKKVDSRKATMVKSLTSDTKVVKDEKSSTKK